MREYGHEVGSVAVLTPYKAQLALLQSTFRRSHSKAVLTNVDFATVDGFQVCRKPHIVDTPQCERLCIATLVTKTVACVAGK